MHALMSTTAALSLSLVYSVVACASSNIVRIDVSELWPGESTSVTWGGRAVVVVKRSALDLTLLDRISNQIEPSFKPRVDHPFKICGTETEGCAAKDLDASSRYRSKRPDLFVAYRISPFFGCGLVYFPRDADVERLKAAEVDNPEIWFGGFYDPCHKWKFDLAGRGLFGRPPLVMEIPPYYFEDPQTLVIGKPGPE